MDNSNKYENEFIYIAFEMALAKSFIDWRHSPTSSFRTIFRHNFDPLNKYKNVSSKEILNFHIHTTLFNLKKHAFISCYDFLRNNINPKMSLALKKIKSSASNIQDNFNTAKFLDIIRQSIVHNDITSSSPNCKLTNEDTIAISYKNATFSFELEDFHNLTNEFIDLKQNRFSFYFESRPRELIRHIQKGTLTEDKMRSLIYIFDDDKNPLPIDNWQYRAIYNIFANAAGGLHGRINTFKSFYNNNFFILNDYFPFAHNAGAISRLNTLCSRILPQLVDNYIDRDTFMASVLDFEEEITLIDDPSAPELRQHFINFMMDETLLFESTLFMNCLFGLFSSLPANKLQPYMQDLPMSASSLRNSLMHGRYFYNYDLGFELYDGKNNNSLVHTGTLEVNHIFNIVHRFLGDMIRREKSL